MITCDQATGYRNARFKEFLERHGVALPSASDSRGNGIVERFEMYLANRNKVENLTLYEGLVIITALYNDTRHSTTNLKPCEIIFGTSSSLIPAEIILVKQRNIQTARDNIKAMATKENDKTKVDENKYKILSEKQVLVKGKAKPHPSGNRYRLIDVTKQTDKTVTDGHNMTDIKLL